MKIGFISQYFAPEPGAAGHPTVVAEALAELGHEVTVVTGFPSYPSGRIYDGYRQRLRVTETMGRLTVHRLPYFLSHDASAGRRAMSMLTFGASSSLRAGLLRDMDALLVYASPATTSMVAMLLKRLTGKPYVLYVQDLWPDSVLASGFVGGGRVASFVESTLNRACARMYADAAGIAVIAEGMRRTLVQRGASASKVEVVHNWIDEEVFRPTEPDSLMAGEFKARADFTIMYAGGMGELQGLDVAVEAMSKLGPDAHAHLALVGEGVVKESLRRQSDALGLDSVSFWDGRPAADMPAVMAAADAQLVSLRDLPLFHSTIPSKVQSSMACALPIVVSAPGDAASLIEDSGAGVAAAPESASDLANAILRMKALSPSVRRGMGIRGAEYYASHLSRAVGARRLESMLLRAVKSS